MNYYSPLVWNKDGPEAIEPINSNLKNMTMTKWKKTLYLSQKIDSLKNQKVKPISQIYVHNPNFAYRFPSRIFLN